MSDRNIPSNERTLRLRSIHADLIRVAAQLVRGEGVPDWSEHKFYQTTPRNERRDMLKALRDADDALRVYGIRLREIADKVSAEISAPETTARREYHANGVYWSGVPTMDMPCDFCAGPFVVHDPRTHACPPEKSEGEPK